MTADLATNPVARPDRPRRRASLAMLMGLVALIAVGLAAMKVASEGISRASFALGLLTLLIGTLGAIVRRKGTWVGFALFGWAYSLAAFSPSIREVVEPKLQLAGMLDSVVRWLRPEPSLPGLQPAFGPNVVRFDEASKRYLKMSGMGSGDPLVPLTLAEEEDWEAHTARVKAYNDWNSAMFFGPQIGHVIVTFFLGGLGALAGHFLDDRSRPNEARTLSLPT